MDGSPKSPQCDPKEINSPHKEISRINVFTDEVYQTFKEEMTPILHKFFQRIEKEHVLLKSFYEDNIIMIVKPDRDLARKKNGKSVFLKTIDAKSYTYH